MIWVQVILGDRVFEFWFKPLLVFFRGVLLLMNLDDDDNSFSGSLWIFGTVTSTSTSTGDYSVNFCIT